MTFLTYKILLAWVTWCMVILKFECIEYSLSKNTFCQSFRMLFILKIVSLACGGLFPGLHHWWKGGFFSLFRLSLCCLRRTTILHLLFWPGDQRGHQRKVEEPFQHFHNCGEDGILEYSWSFVHLTSALVILSSSCLLPFEL